MNTAGIQLGYGFTIVLQLDNMMLSVLMPGQQKGASNRAWSKYLVPFSVRNFLWCSPQIKMLPDFVHTLKFCGIHVLFGGEGGMPFVCMLHIVFLPLRHFALLLTLVTAFKEGSATNTYKL